MSKVNIYGSAGHSNTKGRDRGATYGDLIEGVLAVDFRNLLEKELKAIGISMIKDKDDSVLSDTIKSFSNSKESDILFDIHWNAHENTSANGTEVVIPTNYSMKEKDIATKISDTIAKTLGIKNRGVITEEASKRGRLGFLRLKGTTIIIEICFISNTNDMEKYFSNKEVLAKNLAKVIFDFTRSNKEAGIKEYTVTKGDSLSKIALKLNVTVKHLKDLNNLASDTIITGQKIKY